MDSGRSHCGWRHGSESIRLTSWRSPGCVRRFDLGNQPTQCAISCRFSGKNRSIDRQRWDGIAWCPRLLESLARRFAVREERPELALLGGVRKSSAQSNEEVVRGRLRRRHRPHFGAVLYQLSYLTDSCYHTNLKLTKLVQVV